MIIFDEADAFRGLTYGRETRTDADQLTIVWRESYREARTSNWNSNFFISATFTKDELEMIDTRVLKIKSNPRDVVTRSIIDDEETFD